MATTGWDAKTGVGRYLRHRYPYYNRLQYRSTGVIGAAIDRLNDAPLVLEGRAPRSLVGGMFHQRIGLHYADADLLGSGPTWGRRRSVGGDRQDPVWAALCARTLALARKLRSRPSVDLGDADEIELAELCGVLTLYEQVDVSGKPLPITEVPATASIDELRRWIGADAVSDALQLASLYFARMPGDLIGEPVLVEPNLHPGYADLLLGGLLLELKTVANSLISDEYAYTLLAYALMANDALPEGSEVTHVGWYFARHGTPWIYRAEDYISAMAGERVAKEAAAAEFDLLLGGEPGQHPEWMLDLMRTPVTRARLRQPRRVGPVAPS